MLLAGICDLPNDDNSAEDNKPECMHRGSHDSQNSVSYCKPCPVQVDEPALGTVTQFENAEILANVGDL